MNKISYYVLLSKHQTCKRLLMKYVIYQWPNNLKYLSFLKYLTVNWDLDTYILANQ